MLQGEGRISVRSSRGLGWCSRGCLVVVVVFVVLVAESRGARNLSQIAGDATDGFRPGSRSGGGPSSSSTPASITLSIESYFVTPRVAIFQQLPCTIQMDHQRLASPDRKHGRRPRVHREARQEWSTNGGTSRDEGWTGDDTLGGAGGR